MKKIIVMLIVLSQMITMSACQKMWKEFEGNLESYEYYHLSGKARKWEEDIIQMADNFLTNHPYLNDEDMLAYTYYFDEGWINVYDSEKKETFLEEINLIICDLDHLEDDEIIYRLQKAIASIDDTHSQMGLPHNDYFPFAVEPFIENEKISLHLVEVPEEHENLLYGKLISINGIKIEEILERLSEYQSAENEEWKLALSTKEYGTLSLSSKTLLEMTDIVQKEDVSAEFEVRKENGVLETVVLEAVHYNELENMQMESRTREKVYQILDSHLQSKKYWYHYDKKTDVMYIRYAECQRNEEQSLFAMLENVRKIAKASLVTQDDKAIDTLIIDLRYNTGGRNIEGDTRFEILAKDSSFSNVYVLINGWVFSMGNMVASRLNQEVERAVFVGSPTGQGSDQIGCHGNVIFEMENTGAMYRMADRWMQTDPDDKFDALYPDILVYPTIEDYKQGIDTILQYALNQ